MPLLLRDCHSTLSPPEKHFFSELTTRLIKAVTLLFFLSKIGQLKAKIRCGDPSCTETYIGKTRQTLKVHMNQHCCPAHVEGLDSAVYTPLNLHGHIFDKSSGYLGVKKVVCSRCKVIHLGKSWITVSTWRAVCDFICRDKAITALPRHLKRSRDTRIGPQTNSLRHRRMSCGDSQTSSITLCFA